MVLAGRDIYSMAKLTSKALLNKAGMQQEASSKAMFGRKQEKNILPVFG
jgi:hypothetical protein